MKKNSKDNKAYLNDIRDRILNIKEFVQDLEYEDFIFNKLVQSAVMREFEIIGEAASRISKDLKDRYTVIEWRLMVDFRNVLIHDYGYVDLDIVWDTIESNLPILEDQIDNILEDLNN